MIEEPTIGMLGTVSGIGLLIAIVTEVILRAWKPDAETKDRFGPLLAVVVGVAFAEIGTLVLSIGSAIDPAALVTAFLTGLVAAGVSMGVHDVVTGPVQAAVQGATNR